MVAVALTLLASPLLASGLQAQEYPALHAVTGVAAQDVLNIRSRPDAASEIDGTLLPDATGIEVVGTSGSWAIVNTEEGAGYAALRFLQREAQPAWNRLEVPLTCLGTEPFWELEIDPQAGETRYQSPDNPPRADPLTVAWLGSLQAPDMGVAVQDGIAVLSGRQCSDGMSDRAFGIAVQIFRTGVGYVVRENGCCRLGLP